jgi:hypothetical protein
VVSAVVVSEFVEPPVPAAGLGFKLCPTHHTLHKQAASNAAVFLKTMVRIRYSYIPERFGWRSLSSAAI